MSRQLCLALVSALLWQTGNTTHGAELKRLKVDSVWSGHPVQFALLTDGNRQYVAYYDAERRMTVASRTLDSDKWTRVTLPSTVGWDSHNYITMALDRDGQLHVIGNLHAAPLGTNYSRTEVAGDITTLKVVPKMTGEREGHMTYPQFIKGDGDELIFTYRDGGSGNGNTIYNRYDEKTKTWSRLVDKPLFDGQNEMNAYPVGPVHGPDGFWHITWVWRDTPDASTNHDLSYAKSKDLVHWQTVDGKPLILPISLKTPGVIVDPIPVNGGIINGSGKIGFDDKNRVVIAYHKFDEKGATQMYLARFEDGKWVPHCLTEWTYRWEPKGMGTLSFDIYHSGLQHDATLGYYMGFSNVRHGKGDWKVDPETLRLGEKIDPSRLPGILPAELYKVEHAGMKVNMARDMGPREGGVRYLLRWETMPYNRDRALSGSPPAPTTLQLMELPPTVSGK